MTWEYEVDTSKPEKVFIKSFRFHGRVKVGHMITKTFEEWETLKNSCDLQSYLDRKFDKSHRECAKIIDDERGKVSVPDNCSAVIRFVAFDSEN